jgi:hypothetical protein
MAEQKEHWFDYDHIFDDIRKSSDQTAQSTPLNVEITDLSHFKIYESSQKHKWSCWTHVCQSPRGVLQLTFKNIEGGPDDLKPEYRWQYNNPEALKKAGITRFYKTIESADTGKTWTTIGTSDDSDTSIPRIYPSLWLDDNTILGTGGANSGWDEEKDNYSNIGLAMTARSSDNGKTWCDQVILNDNDKDIFFHESRIRKLRDGTIVLPAYGQFGYKNKTPYDGWDSVLYFSTDNGLTWSEPLIIGMGSKTLSFEEPAVTELGNGDLLVVLRHTNVTKAGTDEVYVNCGQVVVRKVDNKWVVGPHTMTPMGFRGHPVLFRTRSGVLICAGSGNQFNFSIDDAKTWSQTQYLADPVYNRHNHYPVLIETPDGRVMSIYHFGNDWPYPSPEPQWIHATTFRVKPCK